jgi:hypothetical protein
MIVERDMPNALASDWETLRLGLRNYLSIRLMYVGWRPAFSARTSCVMFNRVRCRLSTMAKASDISNRRIEGVCRVKNGANTDNSLNLTRSVD